MKWLAYRLPPFFLREPTDDFQAACKQFGSRSDCSKGSILIWIQTICNHGFRSLTAGDTKEDFLDFGDEMVSILSDNAILIKQLSVGSLSFATMQPNFKEIIKEKKERKKHTG